MKKEFQIWDFSEHEITLRLNEDFLCKLRERIVQKFKSFYGFGKHNCIEYIIIHQAFDHNSMPLYIMNKIISSLKYPKRIVEKNITAYKAYTGRKWIMKPKLPIVECPELYELIGHIIGDGHISIEKGKTGGYTNTSRELIAEFELLINKVFGDVKLTLNEDKRFNAFQVLLPRSISLFLARQFPEILRKDVPHIPLKYAAPFIRAISDDESCVCTSEIKFVFKNKSALEYIRKLMLKMGFKHEWLTNVRSKADIYAFSVKGDGLIFFNSAVKFKHPDKAEQLNIEIKRKTTMRKIKSMDQTKFEITELLDSPKTSRELSNLIGVEIYRMIKHLKELRSLGYVKTSGYAKYNVPIWIRIKNYKIIHEQRKERILEFLNTSTLCTREIAEMLSLDKDTIMKYLHELKESGNINYEVRGKTYFWRKNESQ